MCFVSVSYYAYVWIYVYGLCTYAKYVHTVHVYAALGSLIVKLRVEIERVLMDVL